MEERWLGGRQNERRGGRWEKREEATGRKSLRGERRARANRRTYKGRRRIGVMSGRRRKEKGEKK